MPTDQFSRGLAALWSAHVAPVTPEEALQMWREDADAVVRIVGREIVRELRERTILPGRVHPWKRIVR